MNHKAFDAIVKPDLIHQGDRVCAALSGGAGFGRPDPSSLEKPGAAGHHPHRLPPKPLPTGGGEASRTSGLWRISAGSGPSL